jgi:hypothetical protein
VDLAVPAAGRDVDRAAGGSVVTDSTMSTMPVSSSTVATQIVFDPDIAGYSVGSMIT